MREIVGSVAIREGTGLCSAVADAKGVGSASIVDSLGVGETIVSGVATSGRVDGEGLEVGLSVEADSGVADAELLGVSVLIDEGSDVEGDAPIAGNVLFADSGAALADPGTTEEVVGNGDGDEVVVGIDGAEAEPLGETLGLGSVEGPGVGCGRAAIETLALTEPGAFPKNVAPLMGTDTDKMAAITTTPTPIQSASFMRRTIVLFLTY